LAAALLVGGSVWAADADKSDKKVKDLSFGSLKTASTAEAKELAASWLKSAGKTDETKAAFDAIWADDDTSVLDKVTATLCLGSEPAKKLLAEVRDPKTSAPTEVPGMLKDNKIHPFLRANLALAFAKACSERRIYEESRDCLIAVKAEQVVDPGQYLFLKAVAEHSLIMRKEATESIQRLLEDVADSPERYVTVAALMIIDMEQWKDKDLGWIERKMGNVERRLDLARGGKKTQDIEKQIVMRLDELIKEKENQQKGSGGGGGGGGNGGNCPDGGEKSDAPGSTKTPTTGKKDSTPGGTEGPGAIDHKSMKELTASWGKLPAKERASAIAELTRDMPPSFREAIETYFKKIGETQPDRP